VATLRAELRAIATSSTCRPRIIVGALADTRTPAGAGVGAAYSPDWRSSSGLEENPYEDRRASGRVKGRRGVQGGYPGGTFWAAVAALRVAAPSPKRSVALLRRVRTC